LLGEALAPSPMGYEIKYQDQLLTRKLTTAAVHLTMQTVAN
jgi:hypothetical protein